MKNAFLIETRYFSSCIVIIKYKIGVRSSIKIFIIESYIRNRSYKTTREEFEQKCGAENNLHWSRLFLNSLYVS